MKDQDQIESRVRELLVQVLGVPSARVGPEFSASSTPAWTSLNHLMLISQIESDFGIIFSNQEIRDVTSFKNIVAVVAQHLNNGV
jgi:acyl carrier protein